MESLGLGANLRKRDTGGHIFYLLEKDGAPSLGLSKVIFKFVERDTEIRTMRLPNVLGTPGHNPIDCYANRDHSLRSFGVNPDPTTRLNPWRTPAEFRRFIAGNDPLNEFLLYRNDDIAFTHGCPALRS
jgi:hypothetical protein